MERKSIIDPVSFKVDDFFTTQKERDEARKEKVEELNINNLVDFKNHPFKVVNNDDLKKLEESIKVNGILEPIIVRKKDDHYEIISGHRRKLASEIIGLKSIPCIIRDMTDDDAVIYMVDSNMHRESILPSEKAKAYKMKLDAINHQGRTLSQVATKSDSAKEIGEEYGESRDQIVCTKTLYRYVDLGLFGIKNHSLPEKLKRKTKKHRVRANKKKLGRSIEERPGEIESREEFGHWECDLVLGSKTRDDQVLLTLAERKSREFLMIPIADKTSACVMNAIELLRETYSEHFSKVFKTITTDNGSEFADLADLEKISDTLVYFAHPYTSCDKATVERHNGLIRRFIPNGKRIDNFTSQQISDIETWCNCLPRKILGYRTPDEVFEDELDQIYKTTA